MKTSILADYAANYGTKLRSLLGGGGNIVSALAPQNPGPVDTYDDPAGEGAMIDASPEEYGYEHGSSDPDPIRRIEMGGHSGGSALEGPVGVPPGAISEEGAMGSALESQGEGYTFRKAFDDAGKETQERELTKLEQALKQGNQTIDTAYDDLVKQLGAPPDKNRKLSRKEKGMLLMEFGLSMLANSRKGLAAAAGQAGTQALGSYAQMKEAPAAQYRADRTAVEAARATDKTKLATQSALEGIKSKTPAAGRLPGRFTGQDGFVYFYDENNKVQRATDEQGKPIKGQVNDGAANRGFESESKYAKYMEIYGVDPTTGAPLTGLALQRAKQDALEFANDRGSTLDDLDLDIQAEKSADEFMRANSELFEGMTAEQANIERNRIADERRKRLRRRPRAQSNPSGEPRRGKPSKIPSFNTLEDAAAAFARGEIEKGDRIRVDGVEDTVE